MRLTNDWAAESTTTCLLVCFFVVGRIIKLSGEASKNWIISYHWLQTSSELGRFDFAAQQQSSSMNTILMRQKVARGWSDVNYLSDVSYDHLIPDCHAHLYIKTREQYKLCTTLVFFLFFRVRAYVHELTLCLMWCIQGQSISDNVRYRFTTMDQSVQTIVMSLAENHR